MRRHSIARRLGAGVAASTLVLFGAAACGSETEPDTNGTADTQQTDEEPDDAEEVDEAPAGEAGPAPWAVPFSEEGSVIATFEAGDLSIEVYQVATVEADRDGNWAAPGTDEPMVKEGDELVYLNFVVTNNGAPLTFGSSGLKAIDATYDDWEYVGGMRGTSSTAQYRELELDANGYDRSGADEDGNYLLGTGQSYNFAVNFPYENGANVNFSAEFVPNDADGNRDRDAMITGEGAGTLE
jgi:hypothetical protein